MSALQNPPASLEIGKLLVVDDDANFRAALARPLRHLGYAVDGAGDGQEAFELLSRTEYDLVLLDQLMPGLSGLQTLRACAPYIRPPNCRDCFFGQRRQQPLVVQALDLGANDSYNQWIWRPLSRPSHFCTCRVCRIRTGSRR